MLDTGGAWRQTDAKRTVFPVSHQSQGDVQKEG
jgi:hypothetical protein